MVLKKTTLSRRIKNFTINFGPMYLFGQTFNQQRFMGGTVSRMTAPVVEILVKQEVEKQVAKFVDEHLTKATKDLATRTVIAESKVVSLETQNLALKNENVALQEQLRFLRREGKAHDPGESMSVSSLADAPGGMGTGAAENPPSLNDHIVNGLTRFGGAAQGAQSIATGAAVVGLTNGPTPEAVDYYQSGLHLTDT